MAGVSEQHIDELIDKSEYKVYHPYPTVTIVTLKLPNGFVVTGESACVDPADFDEGLGIRIAFNQIKDKLWELEGYLMMDRIRSF